MPVREIPSFGFMKPSIDKAMNLASLYIYPIKSCRGVAVQQASFDAHGLVHDRRYVVVDQDGVAVTQRDFPILTFVEAKIVLGDVLEILAPKMSPCIVDRMAAGAERRVRVWDDACVGEDCGPQAAEWFSDYLNSSCRLVKMGPAFRRPIDKRYTTLDEEVGFADGYPGLLISQGSLDDLNSRLDTPVPMERFRPNLVVAGCSPYSEDRWKEIRIGTMTFRVVKSCPRCVVTTVDLRTGQKGAEPLRTLAGYRAVGNRVLFGQNVIHDQKSGWLHVGDSVQVLRSRESERTGL